MWKSLSLFFICVFTYSSFASVSTVLLTDTSESISLETGNYEWFEDISGQMDLNDIQNLNDDRFSLNKSGFKITNSSNPYWVRFKVQNNSLDHQWLMQGAVHNRYFEFYVPDENGEYVKKEAGMLYPFLDRVFQTRSVCFTLSPIRNKPTTYYVKIQSPTKVGFIFKFIKSNDYIAYQTDNYLRHGLFYGIIFIMAIYNLILFFSIRDKIYVFYILYVLSCAFYLSHKSGLGFQYIWPSHPEFNLYHVKIAHFIWLFTFILYFNTFFKVRKEKKWLLYIQVVVMSYLFIQLIGSMLFLPWAEHSLDLYWITFLFLFVLSFFEWKKGERDAIYFTIGFSFVMVSIVIFKLRELRFMNWSELTEFSMNISLILEIMVLSLALGKRVTRLQDEKEVAQKKTISELEKNRSLQDTLIRELKEKEALKNKVNLELEQKVSERTEELSNTNEKLAFAVDELEKMNVALDLDNFKLKRSVKKAKELHVSNEALDYSSFQELFPDKMACYRYLSERKWQGGFECKRCGNKTASKGKQPLSKKCTKCDHIETVTAHSLFHGIRFPVEKAFYITYRTYQEHDKKLTTVEKLSELLDLRKNTSWKFRNKVLERIKEQKNLKNWEELIL